MTKLNKQRIISYKLSTKKTIWEAYKKPSSRKVSAYNNIKKEMESLGGYGLRITGAGSDTFSCAYRLDNKLIYH